jgi:hypothetical protein
VQHSDSVAALLTALSELEPSLDSANKLGILPAPLERKAVLVMDGASYHKVQNPDWVPRKGPGALFGLDGAGRHDVKTGWQKPRCIRWLCDYVDPSGPYEEAKSKLDANQLYCVEGLEDMSVLALRAEIDKQADHERFRVKRTAAEHDAKLRSRRRM